MQHKVCFQSLTWTLTLQATAICPESPEPLQALASIQYEQGNLDAALQTLRDSISKWWHPSAHVIDDLAFRQDEPPGTAGTSCEKEIEQPEDSDTDGGIHVHGNHQEGDNTPELVQPSYEFRVECCKLLLELDTGTETALQVLAFSADAEFGYNLLCCVRRWYC